MISILSHTSRSAVLLIQKDAKYDLSNCLTVSLNGEFYCHTLNTVVYIDGLLPQTTYEIKVTDGYKINETCFIETEYEYVTMNVKAFGAKGDGIQDDTPFIQAAVSCCPQNGRVLFPAGLYRIKGIQLKSDISIELAEGAIVVLDNEIDKLPILPGITEGFSEKSEYTLGIFNGSPLDMYAPAFCGINLANVCIYGKGMITSVSSKKELHNNPAIQPIIQSRLILFKNCANITIDGITLKNSPSTAIYACYCQNLFINALNITGDLIVSDAHGIILDSCRNSKVSGCFVSVFSDGIGIRSGGPYLGFRYQIPCEDITIQHCRIEKSNYAVCIGSDAAGGVNNIQVKNCIFKTVHGFTVLSYRGMGVQTELKDIFVSQIEMVCVRTAILINNFHTENLISVDPSVLSQHLLDTDEKSPEIKNLHFTDIYATQVQYRGVEILGLPEKKPEHIVFQRIHIDFMPKVQKGRTKHSLSPEKRYAVFAANIAKLEMKEFTASGEDVIFQDTQNIDDLLVHE